MTRTYKVTSVIVGIIGLVMLGAVEASAQSPNVQTQGAPNGAVFSTDQLDQMLAPIALYPDPLLAQVLMAATYPLDVVQADRWLQDPGNAALRGDSLNAAMEQALWDPSVKSLVPFPQVLHMMDGNLTWTEQLGEAFLASQPAVMDSVQRLRQRAQAAGRLQSSSQEVVSTQGPLILIEPPTPEIVYVPVYDPRVIYGAWWAPAYPPYYFPAFFSGVVVGGLGVGWVGVGIDVPRWRLSRWDWGGHRVDVNVNRFNAMNAHRPPISSETWQHDPSHRGGVPYRNADVRAQFQGAGAAMETRRNLRGYPTADAPQSRPSPAQAAPFHAGPAQALPHPAAGGPAVAARPGVVTAPTTAPTFNRPQQQRPAATPARTPAFESFGRGADVRAAADRGRNSRQSAPAMARPSPSQSAPARPVFQHAAPAANQHPGPAPNGGQRHEPGQDGRGHR